MSEIKMVTRVVLTIGIIGIVLVAAFGIALFMQIQNDHSLVNALKTEIEEPNVSIIAFSWQDSTTFNGIPLSPNTSVLTFNCTLLNTSFSPAIQPYVTLIILYMSGTSENQSWAASDIPARQTAFMTGMSFFHNNTSTINIINLQVNWRGGGSGDIITTWRQ
ncbi:MAG TPA: hypothetical protein VEH86_09040 [Candidatus Acidoferrum sp.]|nr:hypothetical protein [Candidatus Acidoferrum sp.]